MFDGATPHFQNDFERNPFLRMFSNQKTREFFSDLMNEGIEAEGYTGDHAERVGRNAALTMRRMSGSHEDDSAIALFGGYIHDIGKKRPDINKLVRKNGKLTTEEFEIVQEHTTHGSQYLIQMADAIRHDFRAVTALGDAADVCLMHHVRADEDPWKSYPALPPRNQKPTLVSRIVSVVDSLDAIISKRDYKEAKSMDFGLEELQRCSGTQFDPEVVKVVMKIRNELWTQDNHASRKQAQMLRARMPILSKAS